MISQKQKSPNLAETGFSKNIHLSTANNQYRNMIIENPHCENFCIEVLERFDFLLERYSPNNTPIFDGNQVDAFIALSNLEKSINSQAGES